jgi:hypothetical protein
MPSSLSKLQATVTKQEKKIIDLQDRLAEVTQDRNSLKRKVNKFEEQFEDIINEKVDKKVKEIVTKLVKYYEDIIKEKDQRIFELENRLNINSSNSSLPSSQTPIYQSKICNSRKKTGDKPGRKTGHKKDGLSKFKDEDITEVVEHRKDTCPNCGSKNLKTTKTKTRDELEIETRTVKRRHIFIESKCLDCGEEIKYEIPLELHGENQYGTNVKTMALVLTNYGFVSYNRTRKIICGLTNGDVNPSEGYLTKLQKKASDNLQEFMFDVKEKILKSSRNYWDDTVIGIGDKDKACLRVYTNEKHVLYKAHMSKDVAGMDEDGILQNLPETCVVMHDHLLHNYCDDYHYKNIECNAHITRKLEGITQNANHKWSDDMKQLLESTLSKRKENIQNGIMSFTENQINEFDFQYDKIIEEGFKEYIEFKHKYEFEKEENLLEFMRDYKESITNWVKDFSLAYSNNLCESLLRIMKGKMKISYNFKSLNQAKYFANILSYTETCGKFGINKYEAIKRLFENNPYTVQELDEIEKQSSANNSES